jgi:hypothetical protein
MFAADWFRRTCDSMVRPDGAGIARPNLIALAVSMREAAPGRLIYGAHANMRRLNGLPC